MTDDRLKQHLRDVAFTTPVPFSENGDEILYEEVERNVNAILEAGGRTLIPCGNTGEYYSLTDAERFGVVERTIDTVRDDGVVIAGIGGSTKDVINRVQQYEEAGVDGVMIHDPDHTYIHREGLIEYYQAIADSTDLGLVLYKRGPELSLSVISELSKIDNIVGLKFAVNDIEAFSNTVRRVPGDLVFSTGIAERYAPAFALEGAEGFTTGIGSFAPNVTLALQDALEEEDWERAVAIRDLIRPYEELREEPGPRNDLNSANNVPAIKYGLELAGRYGGPVREPIVELSKENKHRAKQYYEEMVTADLVHTA